VTLAKDEKIGLAIAALVGAAALATFSYRQTWTTTPTADEPAEPVPVTAMNDQAARDTFAASLTSAFASTADTGTATADGTTLKIRWDMCSKQMLQRLLHTEKHVQVQAIREATGLSVKTLKGRGFKRILCDDGRKGLEPAGVKL